jgi:endoglycosylceramidase
VPNIAGYDLLNEPGHGVGPTAPPVLLADFEALGDFYGRAIDAIRAGESDVGVDARPIFFEQSILGSAPPPTFSDDPGLVFAPHVYGGSIIPFLSVDQSWDLALAQARGFDASVWIGEYGWFDDPGEHPELLQRATRFGQREDGSASDGTGDEPPAFVPAGSAWWQWTTGCGDPHRIVDPGLEPEGKSWQYRLATCPDGEDHGVVPEWREVVTRPAVRFAPGWITSVASDGAARTLTVEATDAERGQEVVLWFPGDPGGDDPDGEDRGPAPEVTGEGIGKADVGRSGRGWLVRSEVERADYRVVVRPAAAG